jgi:hypothetical protein
MATTTNYSWTTPDDTDLVKDGASAIRTLGSSIDTSVKALSPGTTAGDVDYYTTSTAKARLAIGTAGQVLTVNSGATAPQWSTPASGGMTLISTTSLTGASVTIGSIPSGYVHLQLLVQNFRPATDGAGLRLRINADTGTRYGLTNSFGDPENLSFGNSSIEASPNSDNGTSTGLLTINFFDYSNATIWKQCFLMGFSVNQTTVTNWNSRASIGLYNQTTAITSLVLFPSAGNFTSGTALLYGVK